MSGKAPKTLTRDEALEKMRHYCAYQERCHQEVRYKLVSLGVYGDELEQIIVLLVQEGFLDEERFARSFARGKLRNNAWGIHKIRQALKQKGIGDYNLRQAESEILGEEYQSILYNLLQKKKDRIEKGSPFGIRQKLFRYAYQKGFDASEINPILDDLVEGNLR